MTEIPEHLLKRSKERRSAIGGEAQPGEGASPTEGAEAPAVPAAPPRAPAPAGPAAVEAAATAPPQPPPERPEVAAYRRRRRIPLWALPVLAFLPLWAYLYQATLEPPPVDVADPFVMGQQLYAPCAACHGPDGRGVGAFPALTPVLEDFPDFRDQMMFVRLGSPGWPAPTFGARDKPVRGGMPPHAHLSDAELAQVVYYVRRAFGGLPEGEEEELRRIALGEMTFLEAGLGEDSIEAGVPEDALVGR